MKIIHSVKSLLLLVSILLFSCNNMNKNGSNTTEEGTTTNNNVNAEMENHRTSSGTDTIVSPGSNSMDLKDNANISNQGSNQSTGNENISPSSTGTGTDKNMEGQSSTHGRDTKSGQN